jgi:hypothetical protein
VWSWIVRLVCLFLCFFAAFASVSVCLTVCLPACLSVGLLVCLCSLGVLLCRRRNGTWMNSVEKEGMEHRYNMIKFASETVSQTKQRSRTMKYKLPPKSSTQTRLHALHYEDLPMSATFLKIYLSLTQFKNVDWLC